MINAMEGQDPEAYYKERYGFCIGECGPLMRETLESLFYRGVRMSPERFLDKLGQYGVPFRKCSMSKVRYNSLERRVAAEPALNSPEGVYLWYATMPGMFSAEEMDFMADNAPDRFGRRYPSLMKALVASRRGNFNPRFVVTEFVTDTES
ncbi:MAG: hypothetical protein HUJ91_05970 [Bacteroidales bacterium]|nr:hypothetical protein [Bacteroidales bacterium]